jgi:hypothetical protein
LRRNVFALFGRDTFMSMEMEGASKKNKKKHYFGLDPSIQGDSSPIYLVTSVPINNILRR